MTDQEMAAAKAAKASERAQKLEAAKKERADKKAAAKAVRDEEKKKTVEEKKADKEKKKAEREAQNVKRNGATRPRPGSTTGRVWEIADAISKEKARPAERAEVLAQAAVVSLNPSMSATQYGRWRKFNAVPVTKREKKVKVVAAKPETPAPTSTPEAKPPKKKGGKKAAVAKPSGDVTTEAAPVAV